MNGQIEGWLPFLAEFDWWILFKGMYVLAFVLYSLFSVVILAQIKQMTKTLNGSFDWQIRVIGWVHLGVAVGALLMAFVIL